MSLLTAQVHKPKLPTQLVPVTVVATKKTVWFVTDEGVEIAFDTSELRLAIDADVLEGVA